MTTAMGAGQVRTGRIGKTTKATESRMHTPKLDKRQALGGLLRKARGAKYQQTIAEKLDVDQSLISHWEKGSKNLLDKPITYIAEVLAAFGLSLKTVYDKGLLDEHVDYPMLAKEFESKGRLLVRIPVYDSANFVLKGAPNKRDAEYFLDMPLSNLKGRNPDTLIGLEGYKDAFVQDGFSVAAPEGFVLLVDMGATVDSGPALGYTYDKTGNSVAVLYDAEKVGMGVYRHQHLDPFVAADITPVGAVVGVWYIM